MGGNQVRQHTVYPETHITNIHTRITSPTWKHAEAILEYLEKVQWINDPDIRDKVNPNKLIEQ